MGLKDIGSDPADLASPVVVGRVDGQDLDLGEDVDVVHDPVGHQQETDRGDWSSVRTEEQVQVCGVCRLLFVHDLYSFVLDDPLEESQQFPSVAELFCSVALTEEAVEAFQEDWIAGEDAGHRLLQQHRKLQRFAELVSSF